MAQKLVRLAMITGLWALVGVFLPPAVQVVRANGDCECNGYTYAYDYVPVYYTYEGEQAWGGSDPDASSDGSCLSGCVNYGVYQIGSALCSAYHLGGGKGFIESSFDWSFYDGGLYGGHYYSGQLSC